MKVWNKYRDQMHQRGYVTMGATQEVCVRVLTKRSQFRGHTRAEFCAWSRQILRYWILEKLRVALPEQREWPAAQRRYRG